MMSEPDVNVSARVALDTTMAAGLLELHNSRGPVQPRSPPLVVERAGRVE